MLCGICSSACGNEGPTPRGLLSLGAQWGCFWGSGWGFLVEQQPGPKSKCPKGRQGQTQRQGPHHVPQVLLASV